MVHDKCMAIKTMDGVVLFHLTSHTISQSQQNGLGALYVQISVPDTPSPKTATVFQAANGEFRICPSDQKAFRFKKNRSGAYCYLNRRKLQDLNPKSMQYIDALVTNYQKILQQLQIRP